MKAYIVRYWVHKGYEIDSFFYKKEEAEKRVQEINDSNNSWDSLVNYEEYLDQYYDRLYEQELSERLEYLEFYREFLSESER